MARAAVVGGLSVGCGGSAPAGSEAAVVVPTEPSSEEPAGGGTERNEAPTPPDAADANPPEPSDTQRARRVFLTAATFHGDLQGQGEGADGLDGADRLCAAAAAAGTLGGSWVAWVSTSNIDALSRLAPSTRWTLIDGITPVFASRAALQFGPEHAIDMTETGDVVSPSGTQMVNVWTNTDRFGRNSGASQNDACGDWTGQTGTAAVGVVLDPAFGLSWTDTAQPRPCGGTHHLYCFED